MPDRSIPAASPPPHPISPPRAVVFDMDGLMFNTEDLYWQVGTELMRRRGCEFTKELNDAIMGCPPRVAFEEMIRWHSLRDTREQLAAESEALFLGLLDEQLAPMPGLLELLDALERAGIPKGICTSSDRGLMIEILSRFRMGPRFRFALSADDITRGKPDPEIFLKAAERFGLRPQEMLVLEDSRIGCESAAAAGALVVAVPSGQSRDQDFRVAALVVDSLSDPRLYDLLGLAPGR